MKSSIILRKIKRKYFKNFMFFPDSESILKKLDEITAVNNKIFVFPSPGSPWGYMFQRPQQIARVLSSLGYPVIYCVDGSFPEEPDWFVRGITEIESNLYLYNDGNDCSLLAGYSDHLIVWQYWPHQYESINRYYSSKTTIIYDCIDHINTFLPYEGIETDFYRSLDRSEMILTTASSIYDSLNEKNYITHLVPNGVDIKDFTGVNLSQTNEVKRINNTLKRLEEVKKYSDYVIGYYGAIAEWMDMHLLEYCARRNRNWSFVLVGQIYPNIQLLNQPNVYFFNRVDYSLIPLLLEEFDVSIIPFIINDITLSTSPVKLFEYMAGGKPIVSTKLPEVGKYDSVLVAEDKYDFEKKLHQAISLINDRPYLALLKDDAENNTWLQRVNTVLKIMIDRGLLK